MGGKGNFPMRRRERTTAGLGRRLLAFLLPAGERESLLGDIAEIETEIAALTKRAEKRQMAVERWAKRNRRVKARNLNDRIQLERDERGDV